MLHVKRVDLLDMFLCCTRDSNVCARTLWLGMRITKGDIER